MTDLAAIMSWQLQAANRRDSVRPNKLCEKCGAPFYAAPSHVSKGWGRFCSRKCSAMPGKKNGRYKEFDIPCKHCGKLFHVPPAKHSHGRARRFCSPSCRAAALTAKLNCIICSKDFTVPISHSSKRKFCSMECKKKSFASSKPNRTCASCGKLFYIKACDLKRGRNIGTFCSVKCMTGARSKSRIEDGKFASHLEKELFILLKAEGLLAGAVREFKFHPVRRWRFDFAWPELKAAVEVHGGIWLGGRGAHTSGAGRLRDAEKLNEAAVHGWLVMEVTPSHIRDGRAVGWIKQLLALRARTRGAT